VLVALTTQRCHRRGSPHSLFMAFHRVRGSRSRAVIVAYPRPSDGSADTASPRLAPRCPSQWRWPGPATASPTMWTSRPGIASTRVVSERGPADVKTVARSVHEHQVRDASVTHDLLQPASNIRGWRWEPELLRFTPHPPCHSNSPGQQRGAARGGIALSGPLLYGAHPTLCPADSRGAWRACGQCSGPGRPRGRLTPPDLRVGARGLEAE